MSIQFFNEDVVAPIENTDTIEQWIEEVATAHDHSIVNLNYIFCSDVYLHRMNKSYLDHDTYTDVITFDHEEQEGLLAGDIFISTERVRENAITFKSDFTQELHRVMAHGLLHLLGFNDKTVDQQQKMREKEEACLSLLTNKTSTVPRGTQE